MRISELTKVNREALELLVVESNYDYIADLYRQAGISLSARRLEKSNTIEDEDLDSLARILANDGFDLSINEWVE
jgi:hypothetical protein